jgi:hypothetical protein
MDQVGDGTKEDAVKPRGILDGGKLFRAHFVEAVMEQVNHIQNPRYVIKTFWSDALTDEEKHNSFVLAWDVDNEQWSVQSIPWVVRGRRGHVVQYFVDRGKLSSTWWFDDTDKVVDLIYHCFSLDIEDFEMDQLFCDVKLYEMCMDGQLKMIYCSKNAFALNIDRWKEIVWHMLSIMKLLTEGSKPKSTSEKRARKRVRIVK